MEVLQILFPLILPLVSASVVEYNVSPGQSLSHENCSGPLDYFLCSCLDSISAVTFNVLPGDHILSSEHQCVIYNKTKFEMIGVGSTTTLSCNNFNLAFLWSENILISNLEMINCGDFVSESVKANFSQLITYSFVVNRTRAVFMFFRSVNVTLSQLSMQHSFGYSMVFLNPFGVTNITDVRIEGTTFENDPRCDGYNYRADTADYLCTGSGMVTIYVDDPLGFVASVNNSMILDRCFFSRNRAFYPQSALDVHYQALTTGYFNTLIPLIGEGVFSVYYVQRSFHVTTVVSNTMFDNNNSTICSGVSIYAISSIESDTSFNNCTFEDNHLIFDENSEIRAVGGIGLYYIIFDGVGPEIMQVDDNLLSDIYLFEVSQCNFTRLNGAFGAAMHVEKVTSDKLTIIATIEECLFHDITANRGSALYAIETTIASLTFSSGSLHVIINNVKVTSNHLLPGTTLEFSQDNSITGVLFFVNCQSSISCYDLCYFANNQPSAIYGYALVMRMFGRATFENNTARFGGAISLYSSVLYIEAGSHIYFRNNQAIEKGGAININMAGTDVQTQSVCPIQFTSTRGGNPLQPIFQINDVPTLTEHFNITFNNNTANGELQSITSNLFYVCSWFTQTLVLFPFNLQQPFVNNTRPSVYHTIFNYLPDTDPLNHIYVLAYIPCLCDEEGSFNVTECLIDRKMVLNTPVIPGRSFNLSIITLDEVGSPSFSTVLFAEVYHTSLADQELSLNDGQSRREFSTANHSCTPVEFTISYSLSSIEPFPSSGILTISSDRPTELKVNFNFSECPVGFRLYTSNNRMGCQCSDFFRYVENNFLCDSNTGIIHRLKLRSWFAAIGDDLLYIDLCLPTHCDDSTSAFSLDFPNILCENNHAGQACGACLDGYSRVFGSSNCKKCSNAWLATIVLYAVLGIVLIAVIIFLKLTVALGLIYGLIFFCNAMSINEQVFFNTEISRFSFVRAFISIINLDLGFSICFYDGMTELMKSGLQFVFPVYLWLLMLVIIFAQKRIAVQTNLHTVQVFATLLLLSYAKILRAVINILAYRNVLSSKYGSIATWQLDPTVSYFSGGHIMLFIIALLFLIIFVIPFTVLLTFPNRLMRNRRLNYFFPLVDCFAAPFKDNFRFWFGLRALILIYLAGTEAVIFSDPEILLLSGIFGVGFFAFIQAYILPFKSVLANVLDLTFVGIYLTLSIVALYLFPSSNGYDRVSIAVNALGYLAFLLACFVILYHAYDHILKHLHFFEQLSHKFSRKKDSSWIMGYRNFFKNENEKAMTLRSTRGNNFIDDDSEFNQLRESFLQFDN